jgi:hypothetical protein
MNTREIITKSEHEIINYLENNKISYYDYSFQLPVNNIDSLFSSINHALDLWKLERQTEQSTIQIRVYDSLGCLINGYTQCYGNMNRLNIFSEKETKQFEWLPNNYSLKFENELQLLNISKEMKDNILLKNSEKKYTFVIYWNIWSNYLSRIIFINLKKYLVKYQMQESSLIILVNTDNVSEVLNNNM